MSIGYVFCIVFWHGCLFVLKRNFNWYWWILTSIFLHVYDNWFLPFNLYSLDLLSALLYPYSFFFLFFSFFLLILLRICLSFFYYWSWSSNIGWFFTKLMTICEMGFHYQDKIPPFEYVVDIASNMQVKHSGTVQV